MLSPFTTSARWFCGLRPGSCFRLGARVSSVLAARTLPHQFEHMYADLVTRFRAQSPNERVQVAIGELFYTAAPRTHEMMPMLPFDKSIAVAPLFEVNALDIAEFDQQVQAPIYGGESKPRVPCLGALIDFGRREMPAGVFYHLEYDLAGSGKAPVTRMQTGLKSSGRAHILLNENHYQLRKPV